MAGANCEECEKKGKLLQRKSNGCSEPSEVPPIVHEVLNSPGQSLDAGTLDFFEPRFGHDFSQVQAQATMLKTPQTKLRIGSANDHFELEADRIAERAIKSPLSSVIGEFGSRPRYDFSQVRVHTDAKAAESARAVNALAYTVGRDLVFGAGQYQPGTTGGNRLLAHELTHVVQQGGHGQALQRFATCEDTEHCPRRDPGELEQSRRTPHTVEIYQPTTFGILISNFAINEHRIKPDLISNATWIMFAARVGSTARGEWEILGFTDCQGVEARNRSLRDERAASVASILSSTAAGQVIRVIGAPITDCISRNLSRTNRSNNRAVLVRRLPGSSGPIVPASPGPIGPVRPPGSPGGFCVPYTGVTSGMEAAAARAWLESAWLTYTDVQFGTAVRNLWRDYLNRPKGASLAPRIFRGRGHPIVDAFATDPETVRHRGLLFADIQLAAVRTPEANVPFTGTSYTSPPIALGTLLPAASLTRAISYGAAATHIPGNIAGGTGSSDAGPDLRLFTGSVRITRMRTSPGAPEVRTAHINLQLQVVDAVDFCPGAAGGFFAQQFTIPMSRLEATPTELTYDLPFHVFVDLSGAAPLP
ncbi:MAG: eCIS core domain-containing protein [Blastocatellia bacterium]